MSYYMRLILQLSMITVKIILCPHVAIWTYLLLNKFVEDGPQ